MVVKVIEQVLPMERRKGGTPSRTPCSRCSYQGRLMASELCTRIIARTFFFDCRYAERRKFCCCGKPEVTSLRRRPLRLAGDDNQRCQCSAGVATRDGLRAEIRKEKCISLVRLNGRVAATRPVTVATDQPVPPQQRCRCFL
jgi:hypothetical protein